MLKWIITPPRKAGSKWGLFIHPKLEHLKKIADDAKHTQTAEEQKKLIAQAHQIFEYIRIGHVWRRTSHNRLKDSENLILAALTDHKGTISILDVGVSDGTTSLALYNRLITRFKENDISFIASDLVTHLNIWKSGIFTEYRTSDNKPILARIGRLAFRLPALGGGPLKIISHLVIQLWLKNPFRAKMQQQGEISLSNPLISQEAHLEMRELNILRTNLAFKEKFHIIRAANVLNIQYFTTKELTSILTKLHGYLKNDGYLMVCRNIIKEDNQEEAHGTLYQKTANGFIQNDGFGQGSEIDSTILKLNFLS